MTQGQTQTQEPGTKQAGQQLEREWREVRCQIADLNKIDGEVGPIERRLRDRLELIESELGPSRYLQLESNLAEEFRSNGKTLEPLRPSTASVASRRHSLKRRILLGIALAVGGFILGVLPRYLGPLASVVGAGLCVYGIFMAYRSNWELKRSFK
jgi:hypothetical protein